jgi:hypothetical protein
MEKFHFTAAALIVVIAGVLAIARFLLKELNEFWMFIRSLRW